MSIQSPGRDAVEEAAGAGNEGARAAGGEPQDEDLNLERAERRLVDAAMARTGGNVSQAARLLGVSRDTLRYRLERMGLRNDGASSEAAPG